MCQLSNEKKRCHLATLLDIFNEMKCFMKHNRLLCVSPAAILNKREMRKKNEKKNVTFGISEFQLNLVSVIAVKRNIREFFLLPASGFYKDYFSLMLLNIMKVRWHVAFCHHRAPGSTVRSSFCLFGVSHVLPVSL